MGTFLIIALFLAACLVFYFLGQKSGSAQTPITEFPASSEKIVREDRMLPAFRKAEARELGLMKLAVGTMVETVREMGSASAIQWSQNPQAEFERIFVDHLCKIPLPDQVRMEVGKLFWEDIFPAATSLCFRSDSRATVAKAIELFGISSNDAKLLSEWFSSVTERMPLERKVNGTEHAKAIDAMIDMAIKSKDLADFISKLRTVLAAEFSTGQLERDSSPDAPEIAPTIWDTETVQIARKCVAELPSTASREIVSDWLLSRASSPFNLVRACAAVARFKSSN